MTFSRIDYKNLNAPQKEIYNFQKAAARLADFGYSCIWLSDDWQGADFLACHIDGQTVLRVQLKSRLVIDRKYQNKGIYIAFRHDADFYVYPHDSFMQIVLEKGVMDENSGNWRDHGFRRWSSIPKWANEFLKNHRLPEITL